MHRVRPCVRVHVPFNSIFFLQTRGVVNTFEYFVSSFGFQSSIYRQHSLLPKIIGNLLANFLPDISTSCSKLLSNESVHAVLADILKTFRTIQLQLPLFGWTPNTHSSRPRLKLSSSKCSLQ